MSELKLLLCTNLAVGCFRALVQNLSWTSAQNLTWGLGTIHTDEQKGFKDFKLAPLGVSGLTRARWSTRHSACSPGAPAHPWRGCLLGLCVFLRSPELFLRSSCWISSSFCVSTTCCQLTWLKLCLLWLRVTASITSGFICETQDLKCCCWDKTLCFKTFWFSQQRLNSLVFKAASLYLAFLNVGNANARAQE